VTSRSEDVMPSCLSYLSLASKFPRRKKGFEIMRGCSDLVLKGAMWKTIMISIVFFFSSINSFKFNVPSYKAKAMRSNTQLNVGIELVPIIIGATGLIFTGIYSFTFMCIYTLICYY
jgi:heme/copper-type cytochrome/quinol oxidase subunit 2